MRIPTRALNRVYAFLCAYFWLPCPICGDMFGGHETGHNYVIYTSQTGGKLVCENCGEAANIQNSEWMKNNPRSPVQFIIDDDGTMHQIQDDYL